MAVTLNTGTVVPATGIETQVAAIAGGPFDNLSVYFQGGVGGGGGPLGLFLYATVNGVVTRVAQAQVMGTPNASIIEWSLPGGPLAGPSETTNVVSAAGTAYSVTVQDLSQGVPPPGAAARGAVTVTLAGVNEFDNAADAELSFTGALPGGTTETLGPIAGWAQSLDVALSQQNLPLVQVQVVADCGAGSVQATVDSVQMSGADTTIAQVFRKLALPVFTRLFVSVTNLSQTNVPNLSLTAATTSIVITAGSADITPGPQLTVLRSVVPTVPTKVVWASTGYIDFVADCGADPTGVIDCGAALARAFVLLSATASNPDLAESTAVLFVPPGLYNIQTGANWNFPVGSVQRILIVGCDDASIFQCNQVAGDPFLIENASGCEIRNLTFVGTNSDQMGVPDANNVVIAFGTVDRCVVTECKFIWLWATSAILAATNGSLNVTECQFLACAGENAEVIGDSGCMLSVEDCLFRDFGTLNGFTFAPGGVSTKLIHGGSHVAIVNNLSLQGRLTVKRTFFDEGVLNTIRVDSGAITLHSVVIEQIYVNIPDLAGSTSILQFANVFDVSVRDVSTLHFSANLNIPLLLLTGVTRAVLSGADLDAASMARFVTADATTQYVKIENVNNLSISGTLSQAGVTEISDLVFQGAAAAGGGTFVTDIAVPPNQAMRLNAEAFMSNVAAGALAATGRLVAKCVVKNVGGAAGFSTAAAGSVNPVNSNTAAFAATDPQISDAGFTGAAPASAVWTTAATNAVLTVTNPGADDARVAVKVDAVLFGLGPNTP